jgi:hypothetical protein
MCRQHPHRLAAAAIEERRRLDRAKSRRGDDATVRRVVQKFPIKPALRDDLERARLVPIE